MTDVLRQHSQEITQTTVKQRAAEIERIKKQQAEKQQAAKAAGADSTINTELPKAISMATKEGYEYVRNAQQSAQQKQLEEQRRQRQPELGRRFFPLGANFKHAGQRLSRWFILPKRA